MSKKVRYLFLLAGFIFFLIAAPLAVFYVRGVSYDFGAKKFVATGILAVKSEPKDADIFLNNKLKRSGSGDVKFILPGEYNIALKKDGYQTWQKRLAIEAGQVTWASPGSSSIYLLFNSPKIQTLSDKVLDFYNKNNLLVFLTSAQALFVLDGNPLRKSPAYFLPKPVNRIVAGDGAKNFVLADTSQKTNPAILVFHYNTATATDISGLFNSLPDFQFSGSDDLYALSGQNLYKVDVASKTKLPVLQAVKAFYFQGNDLYYIQQQNSQLSLYISQAPYNQNQILLNNLPSFSNGNLLVTFGKQIYLLADGSLYKANVIMEKITDNISEYNFNPEDAALSVFHSGEFDFYGLDSQSTNFVTRSGEDLQNLVTKNSIGYAFYSNSSGLNAIELDTRDSQNHYILYQSKTIQKFVLDSSGKNIVLLDNGELKSLEIR
jgi:hypothetical protein